jgi:hypothetical protein
VLRCKGLFYILKITDKQGEYDMETSTDISEMIKAIGRFWFICLFLGFMMGGVGLFLTIPIAIVGTIYIIWAEITGKNVQPPAPTHYYSYGGRIEDLPTTQIPYSGYSAFERAAEYRHRGKSPAGVIDGVYNDTYLPDGVSYNDTNRDWDADA